ncbi:hypothetical protein I317_00844 [Kwoniella heveanensis CBS 569]|uniref:Uncharacterized protein n=1 Tax=Kwoniella heveanensis BCC8398 TaxID=1296120 RepID=A0A1B9GP28_9TREE|nr:hypothetical protein I316_05466 [Kwoniella heveanensis BCC8398]OCF45321.1 hypothetical protein I317_00844 [Kwoniella heveanensis CBS 569]
MTAVAFSGLAAGSLVVSKRPITTSSSASKAIHSALKSGPRSKVISALNGGSKRSISSSTASLASEVDSLTGSPSIKPSATGKPLAPEQLKALLSSGPPNYKFLQKAADALVDKDKLKEERLETVKNEFSAILQGLFKNKDIFPGVVGKEDGSVKDFLKNRDMTQGEMQSKIAEFLRGEKKIIIEYDQTDDGKLTNPTTKFVPTERSEDIVESASAEEELTNREGGYEGVQKRPSMRELHHLIENLPAAPQPKGEFKHYEPDLSLLLPLTRSAPEEVTVEAYAHGDAIGETMKDRWKDVRYSFHDFRGLSTEEVPEHLVGTWEATGDVKLWKESSPGGFVIDQATVTFKDGVVCSLTLQNVTYRISVDQPGTLLEVMEDNSHKLLKDPAARQLGPNDPTQPHMFDMVVLDGRAVNAEVYAIAAKRVEPSVVADMVANGDRVDFWLNHALDVRRDIDQYKQEQTWNVRVAQFGLYGKPSWYSTDITVVYNVVPWEFRITDDCVVPIIYEKGKFNIRSDGVAANKDEETRD